MNKEELEEFICYYDGCNEKTLPFSDVCFNHIDPYDFENGCPNCESEKITKTESVEVVKSYTNVYVLKNGSFTDYEDDYDDDYDGGHEEVTSCEIECDNCGFSKYWDYR